MKSQILLGLPYAGPALGVGLIVFLFPDKS
jgi:hypothetical protein